jgi:uncharacterized protein
MKMKLNIIFASALFLGLTACTSAQPEQTPPKLGMANPASQFCIEQGGALHIKNEKNGQVGYCQLKSGEVVEEWAYFRAEHGQCKAEAAEKLVGQTGLSEGEIKKITNSTIVRIVEPGQPVTADYRVERITIVKDPKTKQITMANCG